MESKTLIRLALTISISSLTPTGFAGTTPTAGKTNGTATAGKTNGTATAGKTNAPATAKTPDAEPDLEAVPVVRTETIRRGDLLVSHMGVAMIDGKKSNELEASSFEASSSKPVLDKCRFEIVESAKSWKSKEQSFPPQSLDNVRLRAEIPDFDMLAFMEKLHPSAEKIFSQVVDVDELAGPMFKREDLKEKVRVAFLDAPYTSLPKSTLVNVEQAIITHLWGYWGDVSKVKRKSLAEVKAHMSEFREQWIKKLSETVRDQLRSEAKSRIQSLKSDQLTRTMVVLNFNFKEEDKIAQSKLECWFEGEKAKLTLQRLNAVIGPYFELVPRTQAFEDAANGDVNRGVAVEGEPISSQ